MRLSPRTHPRLLAVLAGAFWLVGFNVLPLAHVLFHEALGEHRHGAHEQRDHASGLSDEASHRHGHEHEHEHAEAPDSDSDLPPSPEHGRGSLAHGDLAAPVAQASLPPLPEARVAHLATPSLEMEDDPSRATVAASRARAPPRA